MVQKTIREYTEATRTPQTDTVSPGRRSWTALRQPLHQRWTVHWSFERRICVRRARQCL